MSFPSVPPSTQGSFLCSAGAYLLTTPSHVMHVPLTKPCSCPKSISHMFVTVLAAFLAHSSGFVKYLLNTEVI